MNSEIIIQTNDLSVYYSAHRGVKDLNLSVQKGENWIIPQENLLVSLTHKIRQGKLMFTFIL